MCTRCGDCRLPKSGMHDAIPDVCGSCHVCVLWKERKGNFGGWSCVPCLLQVSLCVCLGLTQLIQCREYRFAVKVSTCNNLLSPPHPHPHPCPSSPAYLSEGMSTPSVNTTRKYSGPTLLGFQAKGTGGRGRTNLKMRLSRTSFNCWKPALSNTKRTACRWCRVSGVSRC